MKFRQYPFRHATGLLITTAMLQALAPVHAQISDADDIGSANFPVVITPTRLRQSLADVPASVTVITSETIKRYGLTNIGDILRLVPGMAVSQTTGSDLRVNYHGTYAISPRRMNVLVDGVSIYRPAFSRVEWLMLPIALEDIDHIEVIRGPDSSAYGPNSMTAIINILSRHPKDVEPALGAVTLGTQNQVELTGRVGANVGSTAVRLTANTQRNSGLDGATFAGNFDNHDSTLVKRLNVRAQHDMADGATLDVQASYVEASIGLGQADRYMTTHPDQQRKDAQWSASWTKALSGTHEVRVEAFQAFASSQNSWQTRAPVISLLPEAYELFRNHPAEGTALARAIIDLQMPAPTPITAPVIQAILALPFPLATTNGTVDQDGTESRTQIELQDTYVVSNQLRVVGGMGFRHQWADSQTYFQGKVGNDVKWLFGHMEYRPTDWLTSNLGGYAERNTLSGGTFSPRLGLNLRMSPNQTLRAVYSRGTRSPDLFEQRADWAYTVSGLNPLVQGKASQKMMLSAQAAGTLGSERISSRELGYMFTHAPMGLAVDVKAFDDRLTNLISDRLVIQDFAPENNNAVRLTGTEVQTSWEWSPKWSAILNYAYLLNRHATSSVETIQYLRHSGLLGVSRSFGFGWRTSLAFYGASGNGTHESGYGRTDLTVSRHFSLGSQSAQAALTVSYLHTPEITTYLHEGQYFNTYYDSHLQVRGHCRIAF